MGPRWWLSGAACVFLVISSLAARGVSAAEAASPTDLRGFVSLASPTERGEWPAYRGDAAQTGRCLLPGKIKHPVVQWKQFVGSWSVLLDIRSGGEGGAVELPESRPQAPKFLKDHARDWDTGTEFLDLAGDGRLVAVRPSYNVKYAKFLPNAKGYQKFVMEDGMSVKLRPDGPRKPVAIGTLYRYDHGKEEVAWRTEPQEQCEIPLCAVADMDKDGTPDIAVSTWWRVMVFDGATGKKKDECRWHKGRNYGHFQIADLDGDGYPEAIVFADFMIHLDLLRNVNGKLQVQWQKPVDFTLFGKRKSLRTLPDAVVRVGGQAPMLAANIFNDSGDGKWHAMLWDAMSGGEVANLAARFCVGHADLDGSRNESLMLAATSGIAIPVAGTLSLLRFADGQWKEVPLPLKGRWVTHTPLMPSDRASCAAEGFRTALITEAEGKKVFWAVERTAGGSRDPASRLLGLMVGESGVRVVSELEIPAGFEPSVRGVSRDGSRFLLALESASWGPRRLGCRGLQGAAVSVEVLPQLPDIPIVARLEKDGRPLAITPFGAGEIAAVQAPASAHETAKVIWHRPGRTRSEAAEQHGYGVTAADLFGEGSREVLAAVEGGDGEAVLVGYDAQGAERFRHAFPRFSGKPPTWNSGGLLHWVVGPALGTQKAEICATLRRTVMHTDETVVIDPATGEEAWWQDNLEKRGCGGRPIALAQKPQGGCVIVGQYPDIHYVMDGVTGKPIVVKSLGDKDVGGWVAYSSPILWDFNGDGALEALTGACNYILAVMTLNREVLWHTSYLEGTTSQVGVRRNADRWEIGAAMYYRSGFHCYAAKDGKLLWSFKPPHNVTTDIVTCDIDGDGVEEFIFGSGKTLYAVGSSGDAAAVRWQLDLADAVYSPICADADGDGDAEVLVLARDGNLYSIGE